MTGNRRRLPCRAALVAALAALLVHSGCGDAADERPAAGAASVRRPATAEQAAAPSVVLITLDTTRADALGAYDPGRLTSPTVDRLAREGVLFEQASTSSPETLPSHATILTGRWPYEHGVRSNTGYLLADSNLTLAEILKQRGYRTAAEISAKVLREETRISQGFDHYGAPGGASAAFAERGALVTTAKAVEFLRRHRADAFFLWVHYFDPHAPYAAPPEFQRQAPDSPYHAEVASVDHELGTLVAELEALGLRERTLLVLTSDHGEGLYEHGEPTHSALVYESTMRVPLVLWGLSALPPGARVTAPVRTLDIVPTVLDYLGLPIPDGVSGVSLRPVIESGADPGLTAYGEAHFLTAMFGVSPLRFVREGRWKYIHKVGPELYDVSADPGETRNVIDAHPEVAERLRRRLEALVRAAPAARADQRTLVDAETAAQLAQLGYAAERPELGDEGESLALVGPDPLVRMPDAVRVTDAQALLGAGKFDEALALLEPVLATNPDSVHALGLKAAVLARADRPHQSVDTLKRIFEVAPCNVVRREELVRALTRLARYAELVAVLKATTERCDYDVRTQNNYAWALATLPDDSVRDGEKAVAIMEQALERMDARDPLLLDTLSAAQAEAGDFEAARATLEEALRALRASSAPPAILEAIEAHRRAYERGDPIRDPETEPA